MTQKNENYSHTKINNKYHRRNKNIPIKILQKNIVIKTKLFPFKKIIIIFKSEYSTLFSLLTLSCLASLEHEDLPWSWRFETGLPILIEEMSFSFLICYLSFTFIIYQSFIIYIGLLILIDEIAFTSLASPTALGLPCQGSTLVTLMEGFEILAVRDSKPSSLPDQTETLQN